MPQASVLLRDLSRPEQPAGPALGALAGFIGLSEGAGLLGALDTRAGLEGWYQSLEKPSFNPPAWVFAPVWTTLYACMGTSAWLLWRERDKPMARVGLALWGAQLAQNWLWSKLFFKQRRPKAAMADLAVLLATISTYTGVAAAVSRPAAWLFVPYVGWTAFAGVLNGEIVRRNP